MSGLPFSGEKHDYYAVYPITGKVLNVRITNKAQIGKNTAIQDIIKVLKLEFGKEYTNSLS